MKFLYRRKCKRKCCNSTQAIFG